MPPTTRKKGDSAEKKAPAQDAPEKDGAAPTSPPAAGRAAAPSAAPDLVTPKPKRNQDVTRRAMFSLITAFAKVVKEEKQLKELEKGMGKRDNELGQKRMAALWMLCKWNDKPLPNPEEFTKHRAKATERTGLEVELTSDADDKQSLDCYFGASFAKAMSSVLEKEFTADEVGKCVKLITVQQKDRDPFQRLTGINEVKLEELLKGKGVVGGLKEFGTKMFAQTVLKEFDALKAAVASVSTEKKKPASAGSQADADARPATSTGPKGKKPASAKSTDGAGSSRSDRDSKVSAEAAVETTAAAAAEVVVNGGVKPRSKGWFQSAVDAVFSPGAKEKNSAGAAAPTPANSAAERPPAADAKGKGKAGATAAAAASAPSAPPADPKGTGKAKAAPPTPAAESPKSEASQSGGRRTRSSSKASPAEEPAPGGAGRPQDATHDPENEDDFLAELGVAAQHWSGLQDLDFGTATPEQILTFTADVAADVGVALNEEDKKQLLQMLKPFFEFGEDDASFAAVGNGDDIDPNDVDFDIDFFLSTLKIPGA